MKQLNCISILAAAVALIFWVAPALAAAATPPAADAKQGER